MRKSIIIGIIVILAGAGISFGLASMKEPPQRKAEIEKVLLIPSLKIQNENILTKISVIGKLTAKHKIDIYAEVSGVLKSSEKDFLEGVSYHKGETLLNINSDETYLGLMSKRSSLLNIVTQILPDLKFDYPQSYDQWLSYLSNFDMDSKTKVLPEPINNQEKYFIAGKNIYQSYYDIVSLETRLEKYTIKAPFTGVISKSNIKPGTLVMNGQQLGSYLDPKVYDLETEVSIGDIGFLKIGDKVELSSENISGSWMGTLSRISESVDAQTQTVKVYITVEDKMLKEGQFLNGIIITSTTNFAVEIPRKLLINDNNVFTVNNGLLKKQEVIIVQINENTAIVKGLKDGSIVSEKTKGLHEGLKVEVKG